jgi:hypothetical protein
MDCGSLLPLSRGQPAGPPMRRGCPQHNRSRGHSPPAARRHLPAAGGGRSAEPFCDPLRGRMGGRAGSGGVAPWGALPPAMIWDPSGIVCVGGSGSGGVAGRRPPVRIGRSSGLVGVGGSGWWTIRDIPRAEGPWTAAACCRFPAASLLARRCGEAVRSITEAAATARPPPVITFPQQAAGGAWGLVFGVFRRGSGVPGEGGERRVAKGG